VESSFKELLRANLIYAGVVAAAAPLIAPLVTQLLGTEFSQFQVFFTFTLLAGAFLSVTQAAQSVFGAKFKPQLNSVTLIGALVVELICITCFGHGMPPNNFWVFSLTYAITSTSIAFALLGGLKNFK